MKIAQDLQDAQIQATKLLGPEGGSVGIGRNDQGVETLFVYFMEWPADVSTLPDNIDTYPVVYARIGEVKAL